VCVHVCARVCVCVCICIIEDWKMNIGCIMIQKKSSIFNNDTS